MLKIAYGPVLVDGNKVDYNSWYCYVNVKVKKFTHGVVIFGFVRKKDAEIACKSLNKLYDWDEATRFFNEQGKQKIYEVALEHLQW